MARVVPAIRGTFLRPVKDRAGLISPLVWCKSRGRNMSKSDEKAAAAEARRDPMVDKLLVQFLKAAPVSSAYKVGWCRTFGEKTQEHGDGSRGEAKCADEFCWCQK